MPPMQELLVCTCIYAVPVPMCIIPVPFLQAYLHLSYTCTALTQVVLTFTHALHTYNLYCTRTYRYAVLELKHCSHTCKHAVHAASEHIYSNKAVLKLYLYCPCIVKNISCTCTETVLANSIPCI